MFLFYFFKSSDKTIHQLMLKGVPSTDEEEETVEISSSHLRDSQVEKKQIFASDSNQIKEYTDKIKNLEHLLLNQETIIQEDH